MSFTNINSALLSNVNLFDGYRGIKNTLGTHYSIGQNACELRDWAYKAAEFIHNRYGGAESLVCFCYRGFSGISMATALAMVYSIKYDIQLNLMYIRKENEKSHGAPTELSFDENENQILECVFVDDFIDGGGTFCQTKSIVQGVLGRTKWICLTQRLYSYFDPILWPEELEYKEVYYFPK